ncbi:MAG: DUF3303 domain-containing protein [Phycisphaerales bacterium]
MPRFMIVERFKPGRVRDVYERFAQKGRMMPDSLRFIDSWITSDVTVCYQLMEAENVAAFEPWTQNWSDLVDFEIHAIIDSFEAKQRALG